MIEKQELHCHNCGKYVQFDIDVSLNGNHEIVCSNCKHIHYRFVKDGIITEDRWNQQSITYQVANTSSTSTSTYTMYNNAYTTDSDSSLFMYSSWMNATATGG